MRSFTFLFVVLGFACNSAVSSDTAETDIEDDSAEVDECLNEVQFLANDSTLSICLPDDWFIFQVQQSGGPFDLSAYAANFDISDGVDVNHTLEVPETEMNLFTWKIKNYQVFEGSETIEEGLGNLRESEMTQPGADIEVTSVTGIEVNGLSGFYFVESIEGGVDDQWSFPGVTGVNLYFDLGDGQWLNTSAFYGGPTENLSNDSVTWPVPLQEYWAVVQSLVVE